MEQYYFFSGHPANKVVRLGGRLQRHGDGAVGPVVRGPVQLLFAPFLVENGPAAGRPADLAHRLHTLAQLHSSRHQTGQLPNGTRQEGQPGLHNRFRAGEKIQGQQDPPAHTLQGEQEFDW